VINAAFAHDFAGLERILKLLEIFSIPITEEDDYLNTQMPA
jgi:hypothetical protein